MLSEGRWTHDYPIDFEKAKEMGLPVNFQMPMEVYELMELYQQSGMLRPVRENEIKNHYIYRINKYMG